MPRKILLDTDIGSDIDDAFCLAWLLARADCELLGVTTVSGGPLERAKMVSALCRVAGRDVPVYPGTEAPLLIAQKQPKVPQAGALARWPHAADFPRTEAVDFLRRTIRTHPGEVTLLPIGPLTNVALLFALDPEIPSLLDGLVLMGGNFGHPRGHKSHEWNIICDPHAAAMVYAARPAAHRSVGVDITSKVTLPRAEVERRAKGRLLELVLDFAGAWFRERDVVTFHDPLAAVTIFDDAVCGFGRGSVEVSLAPGDAFGSTWWTEGVGGPHEVTRSVDTSRFYDLYFGAFK